MESITGSALQRVVHDGSLKGSGTAQSPLRTTGGGAPTTEHLLTSVNVASVSPTKDVSFLSEGVDADGRQLIALHDGSIDGFRKLIEITQGIAGIGWRITPDHGPVVNVDDIDSSIEYAWNQPDGKWDLVSVTSGSLGIGHPQRFIVSRQIGDTDLITIDASRGFVARSGTGYLVTATMGKNSLGVGIEEIDPAAFATSQFVVKLTSAWAAGDSIMFIVEDLT